MTGKRSRSRRVRAHRVRAGQGREPRGDGEDLRMRRPRLVPLVVTGALLAGSAAALAGPAVPPQPANETPVVSQRFAATYKAFDNSGRQTGTARWHWTPTGGNCCEVYVTATSQGHLLEFGGSYPYVSRDKGRSWKRVTPTTPLYNGEGAIVAGPHGDLFGISWDPYTGDHLQGVRYTAATKSWEVAEAPVRTPVFDREWITYVKGPFLDELGDKVPFLTLVRGGTVTKSVELIATDGLSYTTASYPNLDVQSGPEPRFFDIKVAKERAADYWQPNPGTYTLPLNQGGVLLMNNGQDNLGSDAAWLNPTSLRWERVRLAFKPTGTVRQDSRGWLTMVTQTGNDLTLGLSRDGGRTWKRTELVLPETVTKIAASSGFYDVKVNGALGQAVVATRANDRKGRGQDLVWRVDIRTASPRVTTVYAVGLGNAPTAVGLVAGAAADRFDFPSVALLPDGRIAMSFQDATTPRNTLVQGVPTTGQVLNPNGGHNPALAILD